MAGGHALLVRGMADRSVLTHPLFTGISTAHLSSLIAELARPGVVGLEGRRFQTRGGARRRAPGAGARHQLVFLDRLVATLIHLRHDFPHAVLGVLYGVDRSTVTRAVGEVRRLLAQRGFAVPDRPGLRLRTLEDVFAYAQAEGAELRLDATEVQARRPAAGRAGRRASVSDKKKQNTIEATVIADHRGRTLWADGLRPGRMHNVTAARAAGITGCLATSTWLRPCSMTAIWARAATTLAKPSPHPESHGPERRPAESGSGNTTGTSIHPTGSPSSTRWPTTNAGNNSCAGPTAETGCPTPTGPSPASSPTAQPPPEYRPRPGRPDSPAITHQLVRACRKLTCRFALCGDVVREERCDVGGCAEPGC